MFELSDNHLTNAVIKVIGVGGGGGNAVDHMIDEGIDGVDFITANTDAQALKNSKSKDLLQLGVEITKGRLGLKAVDPDKEFGNAIDAIYGGGFDMSWAVFDGMCVYTMGDNNEAATKKLIDEVKAGGPKQMGSEIQDSIAYLKAPDNADIVGTFNLVRMIGMGSMITKNLGAPMPSVDATSSSNIAFAGYSESDGSASFEIVLPKAHLMEIVTMMQMMQQKQMEQMQQM